MPTRETTMPARAAVALLILAYAGCGASHNKGRIEGKWVFVSGEDGTGALVFDDEGRVRLVLPGAPPAVEWRYKLLAADAADFYDIPTGGPFPPGVVRVAVRIDVVPDGRSGRREMTLTDPAGRARRLVRVP